MITTSVKELPAQTVNLAAGAGAKVQTKSGADSFQNVLDKQTGNDQARADRSAKRNANVSGREQAARTQVKGNRGVQERERELPEEEKTESSVESRAYEAAMQILMQIAESFEMTQPEAEEMMEGLGLETLDLLSAGGLEKMVLTAGQVTDNVELLTDGELYAKYQGMMQLREELVEEVSEMAPQDLEILLEKSSDKPATSRIAADGSQETGVLEEVTEPDQQKQMIAGAVGTRDGQNAKQDDFAGDKTAAKDPEGQNVKAEKEPEGTNLVLDQMLEKAAEPVAEIAGQTDTIGEADTQNIMRQIVDYMKVSVKPDISDLEMQLNPANLGSIQIHLTSRGGNVTAQFFAQDEAVKAAIETQLIQLRETFDAQGIRVEAIEVAVQTQEFEQNLDEQGRNRQNNQPGSGTARGSRRIRLDASLTEEQLAQLTQEEQLAAEMMEANGGSVDYTA